MLSKDLLLCGLICLLSHFAYGLETFDHQYTAFQKSINLGNRSNSENLFDYHKVKLNQKSHLNSLDNIRLVSPRRFDSWKNRQQIAFLINAYNIIGINLVIQPFPVESINRVREYRRRFERVRWGELLGQNIRLQDLRKKLIDVSNKDPRIICALTFPSQHSPILFQAITPDKIEEQLNLACKKYFSLTAIHRAKKFRKVFITSSRLQDFGDLFPDSRMSGIRPFISKHLGKKINNYELSFRNIDWSLNSYPDATPSLEQKIPILR